MKNNEYKNNNIYQEDCLYGMKKLLKERGENCIDLIVTSPPYNIGIKYDEYGDNKISSEYEDLLTKSFDLMYKLISDKGLVCVVIGNQRNSGLPHYVYDLLNYSRFHIVKEIFWFKGLYYIQGETIFVCSKSGEYNKLYNSNGYKGDGYFANGQFATVWNMRYDTKNESRKIFGHSAYFTKKIPSTFIKINTRKGDLVFDPFMGVGTTAVASKEFDRDFLGFELSEEYIKTANRRLSDTKCVTMKECLK